MSGSRRHNPFPASDRFSQFAHVFLESGTYVFRDRTIQEHFLIVTVNEANVGCGPRNVSFQPSSLFQLARHGVLKHQELNLAPNWAAITAVLFVLVFLTVVLTTLAIVLQPTVPILNPLKSWKPRWRSLGEPHISPEYVLLKDSLQYYQTLGPRGSGEDAGFGEKGAAHKEEECFAVRDLEDFSVRTLYDKLEDQNLHLASQLAKHRMDVLVFYNGVRQQIQGLTDMVQALDSEGRKIFTRQRICGHKPAESSWAAVGVEPCDEHCSSNFRAVGHTGAPWQEVTELMKALEILLGRAQHKNISVKQEMEQQAQGQDAPAVVPSLGSLASESKAEVGEGQDHELLQQYELFCRKGALFSFPGHDEHNPQLAYLTELEVEGLIAASPLAKTLCEIKQALVKLQQPSDRCNPEKCLSDSSSEDTRSALIPTDLASLSPHQFVVYRFGCAVVRLLIGACSCPAFVLSLAHSVPAQSPGQELLPSPGDCYYDATTKYLYIRAARLEDAGEFTALLLNAVAWITAGCPSTGIGHSCFLMELNRAIMALANAFFQHSWGIGEKHSSGGCLAVHFDPQKVLKELVSIRVSPLPCVKEKAPEERVSNLEKNQALKLQVETQDRMENSQKSDYNWMLDSSPVKLKVAKLEERLDELNEEFFDLTVRALSMKEDGESLEEELRMQEEAFTTASNKRVWGAQQYSELLDSWATKRDEALLLEIRKNCIARRIEEMEAELFYLQQSKIGTSQFP